MATEKEKSVLNTKATAVITDLKEIGMKVKIFKIVKKESEENGSKYFLLSVINLANSQSLTLSVTETMVDKFGFADLLIEGNYLTEGKKPIYTNVNVVYIPNDNKQYGYVKKDGSTEVYRNVNTWIVRNFTGSLLQAEAQAYEMIDVNSQVKMSTAQSLYKQIKGVEYVASSATQEDTDFYVSLFLRA